MCQRYLPTVFYKTVTGMRLPPPHHPPPPLPHTERGHQSKPTSSRLSAHTTAHRRPTAAVAQLGDGIGRALRDTGLIVQRKKN